jgi:hypothetical protein
MPLNENVEQSRGIGQAALEVGPDTMSDLLEVTYGGQHRQDCLNDHARVLFAALADSEVGRMPVLFGKAFITKDDHLVSDIVNQFLRVGRLSWMKYRQCSLLKREPASMIHMPGLRRHSYTRGSKNSSHLF